MKYGEKSYQNTILCKCTILLDMQIHEIIAQVHFGIYRSIYIRSEILDLKSFGFNATTKINF